MNAWLLGLGSDAVDTITDVVGIAAVLAALVLLVVVETRRSAGRDRSKLLNRSALGVTVLALAIIGGRFQWIPAAGEGEGSGETAASVTDPVGESTTTAATTVDPAGPTSSLVGPPTPSPEPSPSPTTDTTPDTVDDDTDDDTAVPTTLVGPPGPVDDGNEEPPGPPAPSTDDGVQADDGPRGPPASYEVVTGDNFWTIAESVLEAETGGPVSDAEIHGYWLELIDANADQLVEPGNPDLILPGQLLDVPPIGGASP